MNLQSMLPTERSYFNFEEFMYALKILEAYVQN